MTAEVYTLVGVKTNIGATRSRMTFYSRFRLPSQKMRAESMGYGGQCIPGSRIDVEKLQNLLFARFGRKYRISLKNDELTVYAPGRLSRAEINACS